MKLLLDAWLLAQKDLRVYIRDRSALCLGFLVPIALVTVFGWIMAYAFGGSSGIPKITLWVVDEDDTPRSRELVASLRSSEMLVLRPRQNDKLIDATKLRAMVTDGDAHHGIVIPKGYGADDASDVDIKMIRDPGRDMEDRMIQIALMQSTFTAGSGTGWKKSVKKMLQERGLSKQQAERLDFAMENMQSTIQSYFDEEASKGKEETSGESGAEPRLQTNAAGSPMDFMTNLVSLDTEDIKPPTRSKQVTYQQAQSVAGMSVMMLLFGLTGAGVVLIAERETGTLKRLFSLPIARESVLLGKFLFVFV
ncbi:MAG: ABC transporter permease, partial [Pirellula sp.]